MKLKIDRVFIAFSIIFLCTLISIYSYRLIHYYNLENNKDNTNKTNYLYENIINSGSIKDITNGLFEVDEEHIYRGNVDNNYLLYDSILYRIIKIDKSNNIKLISNDILSSLVWGYNQDYENSYIRKWLNTTENIKYSGIFENNITADYLVNSDNCVDKIDDINSITCENIFNSDKVSLLSINDYVNAGGAESYLNINKYFWLFNFDSNNKAWFVTSTGGLDNTVNINETYKLYGIRPIITIKGNIENFYGSGTETDPYSIETEDITTLDKIKIGSYINYSDNTYKVISKNDDSVKIAMNNFIMNNQKLVQKNFSKASADYDINNKNNIAYYLNNDFYNSLKNKDYIISSNWFTGEYSKNNNYDYINLYSDSVKAKVGLLSVGELYINDLDNTYSMSKTSDIEDTIYILYNNGTLVANLTNISLSIRPSLNLSNKLKITNGNGSLDSPYEISK